MLQVAPRSLKFLQFHLFLDDSKKRDWLGTDIKRITFWERLNCYYSFRIKIQTARTPITIFITIISIKASSMYLVFHNIKYSCLLNGLLRRIYTLKFFFSTVLHFFLGFITLALQYQESGVLNWGSYGYCTSMGSSYISNIEGSGTQLHPFIQEWQSICELICNRKIYKSLFFILLYWVLSFSRVTSPFWSYLDQFFKKFNLNTWSR